MEFGICPVSVLPVRSEPAHRAEMISQLLFGELFEIHESQDNWLRIRTEWEGSTGWVNDIEIMPVTPAFYREASYMNVIVGETAEAFEDSRPEFPYRILPGSSLPFYRPDNQTFSLAQKTLKLQQPPKSREHLARQEEVIRIALEFVHAPYLKGGRSLFGIDGPGLIQMVLKIARIRIARMAIGQVQAGNPLHFLEEAASGDLVFFGDEGEEITHAGIYYAPGQVIHAAGKVRIDKLDHHGIFHSTIKNYTHSLRAIIRIPAINGKDVKV